jgi:hypothetical protein
MRIGAYLRTGRLPSRRPGRRADVTCRPLPPPRATMAQGFTNALPPTFAPLVTLQSAR